MKNIISIILFFLLAFHATAQSDQHYTMFMYNKLLYNPAYTGSRDMTSINATYRDQWTGIDGAPKTLNISADGLVGTFMNPFRKVGIGVSLSNEKIGVESSTDLMTYYTYRIKVSNSALAFGLAAGAKFYSANYSALNPFQTNDKNLTSDVKGSILPNFGTGVYWSSDKFYLGASIPNILENYYDTKEKTLGNKKAKEIRGYYFQGGYAFAVNDLIKLQPQFMYRYADNGTYGVPSSYDINLSFIYANRFMFGGTYRTDKSFEAIVHVQITKSANIGYSYDYIMSPLSAFAGSTHEIVLGWDFVHDFNQSTSPRFIKTN